MLGGIGFIIPAPCTWQSAEIAREPRRVAQEVERHRAAGGTLPLASSPDTVPIASIPADYFRDAANESSGGLAVRHFGSAASGSGFESPWVS